jgi:hypothetical protein
LKKTTAATILAMTLGAAVLLGGLYISQPTVSSEEISAVLTFAIISIFGSLMPYALSESTSGSVTIVTFLGSVALVPSWASVSCAAGVVVLSQAALRQSLAKVVFNVAQNVVAMSLSVIAYKAAGGEGITDGNDVHALSLLAAFVAFVCVNAVAVSAILHAETGRPFVGFLRDFQRGTFFDLLALPFVYIFVAVYVKFGVLPTLASVALIFVLRQLNSTNEELHRSNKELLELTVTTLEARDPYTSGHSRRVSQYCRMMGQSMSLGSKQLDRLAIAALLHDVGKVHEVFAPILSKPGKLTPEERAIMESHPIKGAELVRISSHLRDAVEPIRHHHEAWDGSGYPDALVGHAIPHFSRIIAIADTIDAMASDRPYRRGLGSDRIRAELIRMSGVQFDPSIVNALLQSGTLDVVLRLACEPQAQDFLDSSPDRVAFQVSG